MIRKNGIFNALLRNEKETVEDLLKLPSGNYLMKFYNYQVINNPTDITKENNETWNIFVLVSPQGLKSRKGLNGFVNCHQHPWWENVKIG